MSDWQERMLNEREALIALEDADRTAPDRPTAPETGVEALAGQTARLGDELAAPGAPFATPCPQERRHTRAPEGYIAWHVWAERKSRRHYQVRCPGCGLLEIWRRKPASDAR